MGQVNSIAWNTGKDKKSLYVQDLTLSQKRNLLRKKKFASKFFQQSSNLDISRKKERERTEETPYRQTEKEGFEKILLLKSQRHFIVIF